MYTVNRKTFLNRAIVYVPLETRCISEELEVDGVGLKRCLGFLDFGKEFFEMETGPDTTTDLESSSGSARKLGSCI